MIYIPKSYEHVSATHYYFSFKFFMSIIISVLYVVVFASINVGDQVKLY